MKLPRKGILVRIVIYGAGLAWAGYGAVHHWLDKREAERNMQTQQPADLPAQLQGLDSRELSLPDGSTMTVYELSQEQLDSMVGTPADTQDATPQKRNAAGDRPTGDAGNGARADEAVNPSPPPASTP